MTHPNGNASLREVQSLIIASEERLGQRIDRLAESIASNYMALTAERDRRYEQRFVAQEAALKVAKDEVDERLEKLNHLHSQVLTDRGLLVQREVFDSALASRDQRISVLETWKAKASGGAFVLTLFAGLIGATIQRVFA